MANVVFLAADEAMPAVGDDEAWLTIEASADGRYFGTGASWKSTGEWVGYGSLPDDDLSLEAALKAAQQWAQKYDVPTIWVQLEP